MGEALGSAQRARSLLATLGPTPSCPPPSQSIIRVVFHDRRLQYTEHQQLEGWRWSRPGDRILDIGECPCSALGPWEVVAAQPLLSWP